MKLLEFFVQVFDWFLRRPALQVRVFDDDPDKPRGGLGFEVENSSPTSTSLTPTITSKFLYPSKGRLRRGSATFDVEERDRNLPPFSPKKLTATARRLPAAWRAATCPVRALA